MDIYSLGYLPAGHCSLRYPSTKQTQDPFPRQFPMENALCAVFIACLSSGNSAFIKLFSNCPISMPCVCIVKTQRDTKSVGDNNLTRSILQEPVLKDSGENLEKHHTSLDWCGSVG